MHQSTGQFTFTGTGRFLRAMRGHSTAGFWDVLSQLVAWWCVGPSIVISQVVNSKWVKLSQQVKTMDHRSHQLWEFPHNLAECYSDLQRPHPKWSVWTSSMWILLISAYLNLQNCVGHEPITMAIHKHPDKLACKGLAWATILTTHSETRKGSWSDTWISSDQQWHRITREEWASQDSWIFERSCWFSIQLPCLRKMILLTCLNHCKLEPLRARWWQGMGG